MIQKQQKNADFLVEAIQCVSKNLSNKMINLKAQMKHVAETMNQMNLIINRNVLATNDLTTKNNNRMCKYYPTDDSCICGAGSDVSGALNGICNVEYSEHCQWRIEKDETENYTNEKLLPCPICGQEAITEDLDHMVRIRSYCNHLPWRMEEDRNETVKKWNTRNHTPKYIAALIRMEAKTRGVDIVTTSEEVLELLLSKNNDKE